MFNRVSACVKILAVLVVVGNIGCVTVIRGRTQPIFVRCDFKSVSKTVSPSDIVVYLTSCSDLWWHNDNRIKCGKVSVSGEGGIVFVRRAFRLKIEAKCLKPGYTVTVTPSEVPSRIRVGWVLIGILGACLFPPGAFVDGFSYSTRDFPSEIVLALTVMRASGSP